MEEFIRFYNQDRPQRNLKKLTPVEYRHQLLT
ncbi:IS3 family transposase [Paenibacillus glacialis]